MASASDNPLDPTYYLDYRKLHALRKNASAPPGPIAKDQTNPKFLRLRRQAREMTPAQRAEFVAQATELEARGFSNPSDEDMLRAIRYVEHYEQNGPPELNRALVWEERLNEPAFVYGMSLTEEQATSLATKAQEEVMSQGTTTSLSQLERDAMAWRSTVADDTKKGADFPLWEQALLHAGAMAAIAIAGLAGGPLVGAVYGAGYAGAMAGIHFPEAFGTEDPGKAALMGGVGGAVLGGGVGAAAGLGLAPELVGAAGAAAGAAAPAAAAAAPAAAGAGMAAAAAPAAAAAGVGMAAGAAGMAAAGGAAAGGMASYAALVIQVAAAVHSGAMAVSGAIHVAKWLARMFGLTEEQVMADLGIADMAPLGPRGQGISGAGPLYPEDVGVVSRIAARPPMPTPDFLLPAPVPKTFYSTMQRIPETPVEAEIPSAAMPHAPPVRRSVITKKGRKKPISAVSGTGTAVTNDWIIHVKKTWEEMKKHNSGARYKDAVKAASATWKKG